MGYGYPTQGVRNIISRTSSTVAGNAWTKFTNPPTGLHRSGVEIFNQDLSVNIWITKVQRGAAAPSGVTLANTDAVITPQQTDFFLYSDSIDIYLANSSGAATTSGFTLVEVAY